MRVSIVVPVYNMEKDNMLQFCLDSLLSQTIDDYEILAIDDASTDRSPEILRQYAERYPEKIRIFLNEKNRKQGSCKNIGIRESKGEWIGFIDSDDWVTPDFYEKLLNKADETGADVVGCHYSIVHSHTFEYGETILNNTHDQTGFLTEEKHKLLIKHFGSMVVKLYKKQVILDNALSFPEDIFYEDNCAGPLWSMFFTHFELVDEPMYYYFQNSSSTVHTISMPRLYNRLTACEILLDETKKRELFEKYKDEIEYVFTVLYFRNTLFSYMLANHDEGIRFVKYLKKQMLTFFPNFREGRYYEATDPEEEKMINLLMKNTTAFYVYYSLLWFYRRHLRHN